MSNPSDKIKKSFRKAKNKAGKGLKDTVDVVKDKETGKKLVDALTLLILL